MLRGDWSVMRVLIVEDEPLVARAVERALLQAGHETEIAYDGAVGLSRAQTQEHDLIVLDVLLPELDGLMMCRELRRRKVQTPILILTARDAVAERVQGLDAGADDYLTKPFATEELLARVRALARRHHGGDSEGSLHVADLTLDPARHVVTRVPTTIRGVFTSTTPTTALAQRRTTPLVVLGTTERRSAERLAALFRGEGASVTIAVGERGCLRVASALGPDVLLLDRRFPRLLLSLLRAHPLCRQAQVSWSAALTGC
jgi:CheY-like chemotaxis protein